VKAVLHYRASPGFRSSLRAAQLHDMAIEIVDEADDAAFGVAMRDADVLLHVLRPVSANDIAAAPQLKLIQKIGVGVNTIDLEAAKARGVAVCNMPGTNSQAVAEMTLTLMLAALRRVSVFDPLTRRGDGWLLDPSDIDRVGEIGGRVVGFVGYGAVPRRLAPALEALGAEIVYTAQSKKTDALGAFLPLEELLARADILSLHVPSTLQTRGMIGARAIDRMKPGAILINTARGDLVDETALVAALKTGRIAAAGLDVFAQEPVAAGNKLFALPNVVVMPHIAWLTPETLRRSLSVAMENCRRIMRNEALLYRVI
jgi:phosphoglycerate dehydrogenase-like enzyme